METSDWNFNDYELYCMTLSKFDIMEKLGKGSYGKVCLAEYIPNGRLYALKFIPYIHKNTVINGIELSMKIRHKNLIKCYGHFSERMDGNDYLIIILEFFQGRDLYDLIITDESGIKDSQIKSIAIQLVEAIKYLHQQRKFIHRDIKLENIMINDVGLIKIIDYDFLTEAEHPDTNPCGTPYYASPEILQGKTVDYRSDLWSLGVCLYIMVSEYYPFDADTKDELYDMIINTEPEYNDIPDKYIAVISGLLTKNRKNRTDFQPLSKLLKEL